MKHYQTPETLVLQVENNQTLCASAPAEASPRFRLVKEPFQAAITMDAN